MRIDAKVVVSPVPRDLSPVKPAAAPDPASVVKLSSAASGLSVGRTTTQRLDRIRALLDKGEYPVDLDVLAERIVDDDGMRQRK